MIFSLQKAFPFLGGKAFFGVSTEKSRTKTAARKAAGVFVRKLLTYNGETGKIINRKACNYGALMNEF